MSRRLIIDGMCKKLKIDYLQVDPEVPEAIYRVKLLTNIYLKILEKDPPEPKAKKKRKSLEILEELNN